MASKRLTIGYLSADFHNHPVTLNMIPHFLDRDANDDRVVLFSLGHKHDAMSERLQNLAVDWIALTGCTDGQIVERIRQENVDILVFLAGKFDENRPWISAYRAAPIQVAHHEGSTSGMDEMDFIISDPIMCPKGSQEYFSERIIRVPYFYVREPIISSPEPLRDAMVDLSTIVFGSFNNPSKINDEVLSTWGDILRATPGSRLRLGYLNAYADPVLCDRILAGLHVEIDRVIFETSHYPSLYEHLARYNRIDIALDTFPFNGSTTTFEALWMGVPVLSYCGDRVFNRWTASMMTAVGLQALIAPNRAALAAMAASLAADTLFLKTLRKHLRTRVQNSYMCRPRVARRHLDRLYRAMWRQYCAH